MDLKALDVQRDRKGGFYLQTIGKFSTKFVHCLGLLTFEKLRFKSLFCPYIVH